MQAYIFYMSAYKVNGGSLFMILTKGEKAPEREANEAYVFNEKNLYDSLSFKEPKKFR